MNQQLYNQFVDAASLMVVGQKFEEAMDEKAYEWGDCNAVIAEAEEKVSRAHKAYGKLTGFGVFLSIFGFGNALLFLISTVSLMLEFFFEGQGVPPIEFIIVELGFGVVVVVFFIVGIMGLCFKGIARIKRKKYKKKVTREFQETKARMDMRIDEIKNRIDTLKNHLREYYQKNEHLISFLPSRYRNPEAIEFMMEAIENLRADNLTDVINLYEQELHYLEQERILSDSVEMQRRHNESMLYAMETINRNQERINSNLQFVQAMQFIDMLDD